MGFEEFVIDKLEFINGELATVDLNISLLRAELELMKISIAIIEMQFNELFWWLRSIGIGLVLFIITQIASIIIKIKRNDH